MKTAELAGALLDYWVARAEGWTFGPQHKILECDVWRDADGRIVGTIPASAYQPSREWVNGGPIIERERLIIQPRNTDWAVCDTDPAKGYLYELNEVARFGSTGPTPLVAAMRAYVTSKFGDEVPDDQVATHQASAPTGGQANE